MDRYEMWGTPDGIKMRTGNNLDELLRTGEGLDREGQRWIIIDTKDDRTVKYSRYHAEMIERGCKHA